jgi:ubiquinone/menaquinone biosynthesis C-methylase UbiE
MEPTEKSHHSGSMLRVLQSKAETKAFYDKISGVYDLLAEHSEGPVSQSCLDQLALKPGQRALEIGYGTGHCLVRMAKAVGPDGKVYGIDLSEGMQAQARQRLERDHLAAIVELYCGDATHLPYPDASMDAVFFPNLLDCRPIFVRRALEDAGFAIQQAAITSMWVPVEIVIAERV